MLNVPASGLQYRRV